MEGLNLFESDILLWIQDNLRTDAFDVLMPFVSALNNAGLLSILTVLLLLALTRYRRVGITAFFSLAFEFVIVNLFLKNCTARIRPYIVNEKLILLGQVPTDFSFPSGHTGAAFAVSMAMLFCARDGELPKPCAYAAVAASVLIALSRLYNAAHYPTDVLVGMLAGLVTGMLAHKIIYWNGLKKKLGD